MPYPPPSLHCFTYTPEGDKLYELDLTMGPTYSSRETSGVWVFGDWAWKIFPTMNQWSRVLEDCQAATSHGLPTPSFQQYSGTITYSNGRTKEGFALVTTHITDPARFFALKCGTGTLMQLIAPIANDDMLSKCVADLIETSKRTDETTSGSSKPSVQP